MKEGDFNKRVKQALDYYHQQKGRARHLLHTSSSVMSAIQHWYDAQLSDKSKPNRYTLFRILLPHFLKPQIKLSDQIIECLLPELFDKNEIDAYLGFINNPELTDQFYKNYMLIKKSGKSDMQFWKFFNNLPGELQEAVYEQKSSKDLYEILTNRGVEFDVAFRVLFSRCDNNACAYQEFYLQGCLICPADLSYLRGRYTGESHNGIEKLRFVLLGAASSINSRDQHKMLCIEVANLVSGTDIIVDSSESNYLTYGYNKASEMMEVSVIRYRPTTRMFIESKDLEKLAQIFVNYQNLSRSAPFTNAYDEDDYERLNACFASLRIYALLGDDEHKALDIIIKDLIIKFVDFSYEKNLVKDEHDKYCCICMRNLFELLSDNAIDQLVELFKYYLDKKFNIRFPEYINFFKKTLKRQAASNHSHEISRYIDRLIDKVSIYQSKEYVLMIDQLSDLFSNKQRCQFILNVIKVCGFNNEIMLHDSQRIYTIEKIILSHLDLIKTEDNKFIDDVIKMILREPDNFTIVRVLNILISKMTTVQIVNVIHTLLACKSSLEGCLFYEIMITLLKGMKIGLPSSIANNLQDKLSRLSRGNHDDVRLDILRILSFCVDMTGVVPHDLPKKFWILLENDYFLRRCFLCFGENNNFHKVVYDDEGDRLKNIIKNIDPTLSSIPDHFLEKLFLKLVNSDVGGESWSDIHRVLLLILADMKSEVRTHEKIFEFAMRDFSQEINNNKIFEYQCRLLCRLLSGQLVERDKVTTNEHMLIVDRLDASVKSKLLKFLVSKFDSSEQNDIDQLRENVAHLEIMCPVFVDSEGFEAHSLIQFLIRNAEKLSYVDLGERLYKLILNIYFSKKDEAGVKLDLVIMRGLLNSRFKLISVLKQLCSGGLSDDTKGYVLSQRYEATMDSSIANKVLLIYEHFYCELSDEIKIDTLNDIIRHIPLSTKNNTHSFGSFLSLVNNDQELFARVFKNKYLLNRLANEGQYFSQNSIFPANIFRINESGAVAQRISLENIVAFKATGAGNIQKSPYTGFMMAKLEWIIDFSSYSLSERGDGVIAHVENPDEEQNDNVQVQVIPGSSQYNDVNVQTLRSNQTSILKIFKSLSRHEKFALIDLVLKQIIKSPDRAANTIWIWSLILSNSTLQFTIELIDKFTHQPNASIERMISVLGIENMTNLVMTLAVRMVGSGNVSDQWVEYMKRYATLIPIKNRELINAFSDQINKLKNATILIENSRMLHSVR